MPSVDKLAEQLRLRGFREGMLGTSRFWLMVWAVLASRRFMRRFLVQKPEVLYKAVLEPGESLVISHGASVEVVRAEAGG